MATKSFSIRIDENIKQEADKLLKDMGLTLSSAINIFLKQTIKEGKIPFEIGNSISNNSTPDNNTLTPNDKNNITLSYTCNNICDESQYRLVAKSYMGEVREYTTIQVGNTVFGDGHFAIIGGPCSVESYEQLKSVALFLKGIGLNMMRCGAFKPRTSPYSFQGFGEEALEIIRTVKKETGISVVSEIIDATQIKKFIDIDILQVGARNMQNYHLLTALGHQDKPVLLKRAMSSTLQELLMSAEYIMKGGNKNIILCERGIRTFQTDTRNTLDLSAIPLLKSMTHLPILVDPSHGTGHSSLVGPMSLAAKSSGCDGVLIELHPEPQNALSDGEQSLNFEKFSHLKNLLASTYTQSWRY